MEHDELSSVVTRFILSEQRWKQLVEDFKRRRVNKGGETPGAFAAFPYDRMAVERFRQAFPRARWNDERRSWFIPGKTGARRFDRWLAHEAEFADIYGDLKGRDAYAFDPITSPYLEIGEDLRIRTPYSKTIVEQLRAIPWARWDEDLRLWHVPFSSYEELRRRWHEIEEAARRNEPEERRRRREAKRNSEEQKAARLRSAERKRRRYPLPPGELPPLGRPVATVRYGIVVFTDITGELAEQPAALANYPHAAHAGFDPIWGIWRSPTLSELVATWPARLQPGPAEYGRGWWQPTLAELRTARRNARSMERRKQRRELGRAPPVRR